jgi:DNA-binding MarR family transcriptional regulator
MSMELDPYVEELEELVRHVSNIIRKRGRDILADFDITPPQLNALQYLQKSGNLTIGELGEKMYLACSTATDLIDRMERNDLVERERDPHDRRVVRLRIKAKGFKMLEEVMASRKRYLATVLEKVSEEDKKHMVYSLKQLDELMKVTEQE